MAPKKKPSEGIALLSVYSDEDDEEMEDVEEEEGEEREQQPEGLENELREDTNMEEGMEGAEGSKSPENVEGNSSARGALQDNEEPVKGDPASQTGVDTKSLEGEGAGNVSEDISDRLEKFFPPPRKEKCSEDLQRKIDKFLALKKIGRSFNAEVRNRKDYRNPDFLQHAVRHQDIDDIGSCFSKDVFDPHGYDSEDFYDRIEADMKRDRERKEQESKKNQKIEFTSGGTQPGIPPSAAKPSIPIAGLQALAGGGVQSVPSSIDSVGRDSRPNKKSKWDKVDGDGKNLLPSGSQESLSSARAQALLSASNAGSGYTAFVQQRRKEAEERKSSERKPDRRS